MSLMDNKFKKFEQIFLEKNKKLNLISGNDEKYLYEKHIFDSLSITKFFEKNDITKFSTILDIGTGGGFPAIPIAIQYPYINVTAIDSIKKKINAVNEISQELGLKNLTTICDRVENIKDKKFDIVVTRAVAKLDLLIKYAIPLLNKNGFLIAYKSKTVNEEIDISKNILKKYGAKIVDIINYTLPTEEYYERNLVIIKNA